MGASSKKDAKETEAETEPPGTPAKEEGSAPPEQQSTPVDRPPPRMQMPWAPDGWQCPRAFDGAMDQLTMHACGVCSETWFSDMRSTRGGGYTQSCGKMCQIETGNLVPMRGSLYAGPVVDRRMNSETGGPYDGRPIFKAALPTMERPRTAVVTSVRLQEKRRMYSCQRCQDHAKARFSKYSTTNNLDPGYILPWQLSDLYEAEKALISRVAAMVSYYYISETSTGYHKNVANIVQSVHEVAEKLPRAPATCGIVKVRVEGKNKSHRDFKVRKRRVLEALLWLQANNPLYEDVEIDESVLNSLPEDGVIEATECDGDDVPEDEFGSDDDGPRGADEQDDEDDAYGAEARLDTESGMITGQPVAHEALMRREHIERAQQPVDKHGAKRKFREYGTMHEDGDSEAEEEAGPMHFPKREGIIDEFNSPGFIAMAFPHLFPYGIGDITQERLGEEVPLKDFFKHLMRYCGSR